MWCALYVIMLYYHFFSCREQMAKEMSDILSRLVQRVCRNKYLLQKSYFKFLLMIWTSTCCVNGSLSFHVTFLYENCQPNTERSHALLIPVSHWGHSRCLDGETLHWCWAVLFSLILMEWVLWNSPGDGSATSSLGAAVPRWGGSKLTEISNMNTSLQSPGANEPPEKPFW